MCNMRLYSMHVNNPNHHNAAKGALGHLKGSNKDVMQNPSEAEIILINITRIRPHRDSAYLHNG